MPLRDDTNDAAASDRGIAAADPVLGEDAALALLKKSDLPPEAIEQLSKHGGIAKSHKVRLAMAAHPRTPRHISIPLLRHLFSCQLMDVALAPRAPAEVRVAAEEALIHRLATIPSGQKLSLARRASRRVAEELLLDAELRVMQAALENSRLTEASMVKALLHRDASAGFVLAVCHHPMWPLLREVRIALLRSEWTPLVEALEFARELPRMLVNEILQASNLPERVKAAVRKQLTI